MAEQPSRGRVVRLESVEPISLIDGQQCRVIVGDSMLANFVYFGPNVEAPTHDHVEEQLLTVLQGEISYHVDGVTYQLRPGDVAMIPASVPHGGVAGPVGCVALETFTPPRATLVEALLGA